jgi:uncharacterized protein (UPF0276 family)
VSLTRGHASPSPIPAQAGIGLRFPHQALALSGVADAAWFEVHAENYLQDAAARAELQAIGTRYPLSIHAVGLSLGSAHGIDAQHLNDFHELVVALQPGLVSDHLSWSSVPGVFLPDLLPLPYTHESLIVMCRNVDTVQAKIGRQLLVENPSTYLQYMDSPLSEAQFMAELVRRTGCGVLLDVNNVYVSACNREQAPAQALDEYLQCLDARSIGEIHLAGHATLQTDAGRTLRIDDHGSAICDAVWSLYEQALAALGPRPTLIEWDTRIPPYEVLVEQAALAQHRLDDVGQPRALAG